MNKSNTRQIAPKPIFKGFLPKGKPKRKAKSNKSMGEWRDIRWRKLERVVFKLQKRIYKASQRGDVKAVRRLQKTLMKSWSAKYLAVRRVTQDNKGVRRENRTLGASALNNRGAVSPGKLSLSVPT